MRTFGKNSKWIEMSLQQQRRNTANKQGWWGRRMIESKKEAEPGPHSSGEQSTSSVGVASASPEAPHWTQAPNEGPRCVPGPPAPVVNTRGEGKAVLTDAVASLGAQSARGQSAPSTSNRPPHRHPHSPGSQQESQGEGQAHKHKATSDSLRPKFELEESI